ncbi:hypothetical protein CSHISOI_01679 [Colletotrichum shisoi]|uniref:Uncharacterized protein n=1 Tax=Colletotrichum shisoi TaxID=2078593 RepID=A0A5Q4C3Y2_9PEZI|nr:hypothetical protein CSHISOI_01679 [Colletotrichum shisoi]
MQTSNLVVPKVVAVREDEEGRGLEIIPQQFGLRVPHSSKRLVLFRLDVSITDSTSTKSTLYLQITADSLDSLVRIDYEKTNADAQNPPYLENVLKQLKLTHSVTRLQFRLRSGEGIQFAVPFDFDVDKIPDGEARSTFEYAESLAAASRFSLYFQHTILKKESFAHYKEAISPSPTEALRKSYKDMCNVKRLYIGVGGKPPNNVEKLQRRVERLEERYEELEEDCSTLKEHQEQTDVDIGDLLTDVIELKTGYEEVMKQIPDVCDEFKDLKEGMEDTLKENIHEFIQDSMAKQIAECVEAHVDEMKGKLRQALR